MRLLTARPAWLQYSTFDGPSYILKIDSVTPSPATPGRPEGSVNERLALTHKGRVVAVLATLRDRRERLTPEQQAEAGALVERLAAAYRSPRTPRVPLVGRMAV